MMISENSRSASSSQAISPLRKLDESARQFSNLLRDRNPFRLRNFDRLKGELEEYRAAVRNVAGFDLESARIFEIGCGQRPYRLFWLRAHGLNATAIDMDKVVFSMAPREIIQSLRSNGFERTAKTTLRYIFFDITENKTFRQELTKIQGARFDWPLEAIAQGDATVPANWPKEEIDFIYSEDVFEHIPAETLPRLCTRMAAGLSERGIALVRPLIFTGIQGGHNVEYYNLDPARRRNCPPWDHLRSDRFPANTYLNRMTLADYRELFATYFDILEETVRDPDKGRAFMTEDLREELSQWPDEELYSNHVRFLLRRKRM